MCVRLVLLEEMRCAGAMSGFDGMLVLRVFPVAARIVLGIADHSMPC